MCYLSNADLVAALESCIAFRLAKAVGIDLDDSTAYRGLLPHLPLIWSSRGNGLSQNTKRRVLETGELREYKCCDSLQSHLSRLYKKAGIPLGSSHSGRRTFAHRVLEKTGDMEVLANLLGHESIDCTLRYVSVDKGVLCEMFANSV